MHPKRIFAILYTAGLVALLWYGFLRGPSFISDWWFTDQSNGSIQNGINR